MKRSLSMVCAVACLAAPALAQQATPPEGTISAVVPVRPATVATPASPVAAAPQAAYFPVLPPSRPCAKKHMVGVWKLRQIYENPAGNETSAFAAQPSQYLYFNWDDTYKQYKSSTAVDDDAAANQMLNNPSEGLLQYVINDKGIVFFYKNSVSTDSLACFIVANATEQFAAGQLLMMPPMGQSAARMVRVYDMIMTVPGGDDAAATDAAPTTAEGVPTMVDDAKRIRKEQRAKAKAEKAKAKAEARARAQQKKQQQEESQ